MQSNLKGIGAVSKEVSSKFFKKASEKKKKKKTMFGKKGD